MRQSVTLVSSDLFHIGKKGIGILAVILLFVGCRPSSVMVRPTVTVSCAPQVLGSNEWATLTVLQIYRKGDGIVTLKEDKLGQVALCAMRSEISDPNDDGSGYKLCIYSVKPIGTNVVTIDDSFFLNASGQVRPVTFRQEPVKR
jgi:hypothetical protein